MAQDEKPIDGKMIMAVVEVTEAEHCVYLSDGRILRICPQTGTLYGVAALPSARDIARSAGGDADDDDRWRPA